jgi:glyoxylase-like metal-dependent hydrolase (beta-lactamase superfamily II)
MPNFICMTCGTQFPDSPEPPSRCPICDDERQYVGWQGQQWTTLEALRQTHKHILRTEEPNLTGIGTEPSFAIGQRALLVHSPNGNILWDCISFIDQSTVDAISGLGGITGIAISHPHYYSSMVEWSQAFGGVPIYLHAADRQWVMRPDPAVVFWEGETHHLGDSVTLVRCGGHFEGGTVLHWSAGAEGRGLLLTGDIIQVVSDRRYVSFMRSYPNLIPLNKTAIQRIVASVEPLAFDRIYGAWFDRVVVTNAKAVVKASEARYLRAIEG